MQGAKSGSRAIGSQPLIYGVIFVLSRGLDQWEDTLMLVLKECKGKAAKLYNTQDLTLVRESID